MILKKLQKDKKFTELLTGSGNALILKMLGMGLGYLSLLVISNAYGASILGLLTLSVTIVSIFSIIPKFGMNFAIVRIVGEQFTHNAYSDMKDTIYLILKFVLLLAIIFSLILYSFAELISISILEKSYISEYLKIISISIISTSILVVAAFFFQAIKHVKSFMFLNVVVHQILFLLLIIINYYFLDKLFNIIEIYVIANIISAVISLLMLNQKIQLLLRNKSLKNIKKYDLKKIIKISFPMLFASSFSMILSWTAIIMLGVYATEKDVGIYAVAYKLGLVVSLSLLAVNAIATPKFVEYHSMKNYVALEKIAKQSTKLIFYTSTPALIIYLAFPEYILSFFGEDFLIGSSVLMILSIGQFINAMSGSCGNLMQMTNHQKIYQNVIIISVIINIVLNLILIPLYGIIGAAISTTVTMIFWNVVLVYYVKVKLGFLIFYIPKLRLFK